MGRSKKILITRERDAALATFSVRVPRALVEDLAALRAAAAQAQLELPVSDLIADAIRSIVRAARRELDNSQSLPPTTVRERDHES